MKHASLFTGMGGFDLAAEWMGWENVFHCEWNPLLKKYLEKRYPTSTSYADIKKTDFTAWRGAVDVLSGGFPCQPYSLAGQRKGKDDERHLWPEMLRCIREVRPQWVVGENVLGIVNWNNGMVFDEVQADLETEGYEVTPYVLPACAQDAPHRRDRVWFVAYTNEQRIDRGYGNNSEKERKVWKRTSEPDSHSKIITDTPSDRRDGKWTGFEAQEGQQQEPGSTGIMEGRFEGLRQSGATSDTDNRRRSQHGFCAGGEMPENGIDGIGSTADTDSQRPKERMQASTGRQNRPEDTPRLDDRIERLGGKWDASDTDGLRLRGQGDGEGKSRFLGENGTRSHWSDFPTQSPVRTGNDGFPDELFRSYVRDYFGGNLREEEIQQILQTARSRFAKAAIMACGNAVVPQVVYQIFKAIEAYEYGKIQTSTL